LSGSRRPRSSRFSVEAFQSKNKEATHSFGDVRIVLASERFSLRFTSDRGQLFVDVAPPRSVDLWYDLSEVLKAAGMRSVAGPYESAEAAVDEVETHEALIIGRFADASFLSNLVARH
jgi:hypothetical protein